MFCVDKNHLMVKYPLGKENPQLFASRYKLHLASEREVAAEIRHELNDAA